MSNRKNNTDFDTYKKKNLFSCLQDSDDDDDNENNNHIVNKPTESNTTSNKSDDKITQFIKYMDKNWEDL